MAYRAAAGDDPAAEEEATFNAADTNQDGVLSMEEYADFMRKKKQNADAKGQIHFDWDQEVSEDLQRKMYEFNLHISGVVAARQPNAGQEGVTGITLAGYREGGSAINSFADAIGQQQQQ